MAARTGAIGHLGDEGRPIPGGAGATAAGVAGLVGSVGDIHSLKGNVRDAYEHFREERSK